MASIIILFSELDGPQETAGNNGVTAGADCVSATRSAGQWILERDYWGAYSPLVSLRAGVSSKVNNGR